MAGESDHSRDWIPPALLILAAVLLGLVAFGIYAATGGDSKDPSVAGRLEQYTGCLRDHGANVPVIENRSDGGFAVIVPGALLEGDVDLERWMRARDQCRHLEPNPLELLFSTGGLDLGGLSLLGPALDRGFGSDRRGPPISIRETCERLEAGEIRDLDAPEYLFRLCEAQDG